jgi:MoaA/NifB/PqqE/SkfB family radical SAM enzyme
MVLPLATRIVEQMAEWDPKPVLVLMGGEPLLHPDWSEVVRRAKHAGLPVHIITNGTPVHAQAETIAECAPDRLSISLDGPREVHDSIRGQGTFDRVVAGIAAVAEHRNRHDQDLPQLHVAATICEATYRSLAQLAHLLRAYPITELSIQHLYFVTKDQLAAHWAVQEEALDFPPLTMEGVPADPGEIDGDRLVREIETLKSMALPFQLRFSPDYPVEEVREYYADLEGYRRKTPLKCRFIWEVTTIYPDGAVTPCMNYLAGRIGESSLNEIWNSRRYRRFRLWNERHGRFPACQRCCN